MGTKVVMPQDVGKTSNFISKPGQYHCAIQQIVENPTNKDGNLIDWAELRLSVSVLGGTESSEIKKTGDFLVAKVDLSSNDGGEFQSKKICRVARAAGILPQAAPGQEVEIDWSKAAGRQIVLFLSLRKGSDDKERIDIDRLGIYHVKEDDVKHVPKDKDALKMVKDPAPSSTPTPNNQSQQPQQKKQSQTSESPPETAPVQQEAQPIGAGAGEVNFDDL